MSNPYKLIVFVQDNNIHQQDRVKCHTACNAHAQIEEYQNEFTVLPWPANSLDLNQIENLWDYLN